MAVSYIEHCNSNLMTIVRSPYSLAFKYDTYRLKYTFQNSAKAMELINSYLGVLLEIEIIGNIHKRLLDSNDTEALCVASVLEDYSSFLEADLWDVVLTYDGDFLRLADDDDASMYYDTVADKMTDICKFFNDYIDYNTLVNTYFEKILYTRHIVPEQYEARHPYSDPRIYFPMVMVINDIVYIYFEYTLMG